MLWARDNGWIRTKKVILICFRGFLFGGGYGGCYRIYLLEGEPLGLPLHRTRAGEYFTLRANSPAEVEMEIVQIYRNQRGKEK